MKYRLKLADETYDVEVDEVDLDVFEVRVGEHEFKVELVEGASGMVRRGPSAGQTAPAATQAPAAPSTGGAQKPAKAAPATAAAPRTGGGAAAGAKSVAAPMPGKVLRVLVGEGQEVAAGEVVAILEAMKMENELRAKADGTVERVAVREGQNVAKGELIVEVA